MGVVELLNFNDKIKVGGDLKFSSTNNFQRLEYTYDYQGRRVEKKEFNNNTLIKHTKFVYDGFKLIAEFDVLNNNALISKYAWAEDNLLTLIKDNASYYYMVDGNKNIVGLVDENAVKVNSYEYSPFGKVLADNETIAQPFKFSSEYADDETGLIYYNYRYYNPENGKWLKRDPIAEKGGLNIYGLVNNNPVIKVDNLGLDEFMKYAHRLANGSAGTSTSSAIRYDLMYEIDGVKNKKKNEFKGLPDHVIILNRNLHNSKLISAGIDFKKKINKLFKKKKYHKKCHCIENIVLIQHGEAKSIRIPNSISEGQLNLFEEILIVQRPKYNIKTKKSSFVTLSKAQFLSQDKKNYLGFIKQYLCKDKATVEFFQCSVGMGSGGKKTHQYLKEYFGNNVDVIIYSTQVQMSSLFGYRYYTKGNRLK